MEFLEIVAADGLSKVQFLPERGALMTSLIMNNQERLYLHDFFLADKIDDLPGGLPFLFPVCGRLEYQEKIGFYCLNGKEYQLPIHGFSWNKAWSVINHGQDFIEMKLSDDVETFAQYPFHFEIVLRYEISPGKLLCSQQYKNLSPEPMPYYAGFHPYFKNAVKVSLAPIKQFSYNKNYTQFTSEKNLSGARIVLDYSQINQQLFLLGEDKKIEVVFENGTALVIAATEQFSYVQLYTQANHSFICVEPWMGFPNSINSGASELRWLEPNTIETGSFVYQDAKNIIFR